MKLNIKANENVTVYDRLEYVVYDNKEKFIISGRALDIEDSSKPYDFASILLNLLNLKNEEFQNLENYIGLLMSVVTKKPYNLEKAIIQKTKIYIDDINSNKFDNKYDIFKIVCELGYFKTIQSQERHDLKKAININNNNIKKYSLENLNHIYKLYKNKKIKTFTTYQIKEFEDFIVAVLSEIFKNGKTIVKCKNCGKYFIPGRSDGFYCSNSSPQDKTKTCKKFAPQNIHSKSPECQIHTKIRKSLHGKMKYYENEKSLYDKYKNNFDNYMNDCNQIENNIKNKESINWLKEQAKKYNIELEDKYL